jgi:acetyltransferase-like isoleucine patch superfamily enzyme
MFNKILFLIFKVGRKINNISRSVGKYLTIRHYTYISNKRFVFKKGWKIGKDFSIQHDLSSTQLLIEEDFQCRNGFKILLGNNGSLNIGETCFFNNNCSINCLGKIDIGNKNQFGENVLMYDHNHQFGDNTLLIADQGYTIGKIVIGNNCWIGSNVTILKDVTIGDNSIIGAGCVLHKSVPPDSVVINKQNLLIKSRK